MCICQCQISLASRLIQEGMPGKIDKDKITGTGNMHTCLRDKRFHQFACGICALHMLYIRRCPIAAFCIDQPLSKCSCIIFCILQRFKGRIQVGIGTYNDSQASAHTYTYPLSSQIRQFCLQQIMWLLYDTVARV